MRAKEFISEKYLSSIDPYKNGKVADILINPTMKDMHTIAPSMVMRGFLTSKDIILWHEFGAIHAQVAEHLGNIGNDVVPIHITFDGLHVYIMVTDYSKRTKWHHNPELAEYIRKHPKLSKYSIDDIDYYDSAIVGDWEKL